MTKRIIVAGGGVRGLMFTRMLSTELRRNVAAIAEPKASVRQSIRRQLRDWKLPDIALYDSLNAVVAAIPRSQADIVFLMAPDWAHLDVLRTAIPAGCHVFLEKPLATTRPDVLEIARLAHTTDKTIQVGFVLRYSAFYRTIKDIVASGALGRLVTIQMNERMSLAHGAFFCRSWHRKIRYTGGFLNEKCSHDLDLMCWFKEGQAEPAEILSSGGRHFTPPRKTPELCGRCRLRLCPYRQKTARCVFHSDGDVTDHQSVMVRFSDGTQGLFSAVAMSPVPGRDIRIFGTDGYLEGTLEEGRLRVKRYGDGSDFREIDLGTSDPHGGGDTRIVAEFLDCVERHERPASTVCDGARASLLAFAADESVATGKAMPLAETLRELKAECGTKSDSRSCLSGRGLDSNLVIRGAQRPFGYDYMIGNPTDWPLDVRLRGRKHSARFALPPHARIDLNGADGSGKLLGATATVAVGKAKAVQRCAEEKMALYRRLAELDDPDIKKVLSFLHIAEIPALDRRVAFSVRPFTASQHPFPKVHLPCANGAAVRDLRMLVRALAKHAKRKDWLTMVRQTGGYAFSQLEQTLRLLPEKGARQAATPVPIRVACGSKESFQGTDGLTWVASQPWIDGLMPWGYIGGERFARGDVRVRGTRTPQLYQNEHCDAAGYRFRVANGRYSVCLHFMEAYEYDEGQRRFDVCLQGQVLAKGFDVYKEAGGAFRALVKSATVAVTDGVLTIDLAPGHGAMINGIEIVSDHV